MCHQHVASDSVYLGFHVSAEKPESADAEGSDLQCRKCAVPQVAQPFAGANWVPCSGHCAPNAA